MKNIFIKKATEKHGNKFDYSNIEYVNARTLVDITCNKHGNTFQQTPSRHLTSMYCCPMCRAEIGIIQKESFKNKTIGTLSDEEVILTINNIYGENCFTFDKMVYKNNKTPFTLVCSKHGTEITKLLKEFKNKVPNNHCPDCKKEITTVNIKKKFIEKHGTTYNYSRCPVDMTYKSKVQIECPTHGWFERIAGEHLRSDYGCGICGSEVNFDFKKSNWINIGNQKHKTPKLYCLLCQNDEESFIKIGITVNNIKTRYSSKKDLPYSWSILFTKESTAENIWTLEQLIKEQNYKQYTPSLYFHGRTECYDISETDLINSFPRILSKYKNILFDKLQGTVL